MTKNNHLKVLERIGYPANGSLFVQSDPNIVKSEFHIARKNKVAALLVQRYRDRFSDPELPEYAQERIEFVDQMKKSHRNLNKIIGNNDSIALVKSSLPFWIDASDIDILAFDSGSIQNLRDRLDEEGYIIKGQSPTAVGALDPKTEVEIDAQTNFSAQHVTYFDSETLSEGVERRKVYGTRLPCVSLPRDLALIAVHSITEQMFTLKEYYAAVSILERLSESNLKVFERVIRRNHAKPAVKTFFSLVYGISEDVFDRVPPHREWFDNTFNIRQGREIDRLRQNDYSLPHNYSLSTFLWFCISKTRNPLFRRTMARQAIQFLDPRSVYYFASKVVERRTRDHYAANYDET